MSTPYSTPREERYTRPDDCASCGRSKRECDDSAAHGWDNCCMSCDEMGRVRSHRTLTVIEATR